MNKLAVLGSGAAMLLAAVPAAAVTTFAGFAPSDSNPNIQYSGNMAGAGTLSDLGQLVTFSFYDAGGSTSFDALMTLSANTGAATIASGLAVLPISSGTLSFTTASAVSWGGHTGTNLLTVAFDGGALTANMGGTTAAYGASSPPQTVTFTSDFLNFSGSTERDLALAIEAISPRVGLAFQGARYHTGSVTGLFGADVVSGNPQPAVPEPASWALMLGGFGLVGTALRSQRRRRVDISFG
jgi:hypothetical protein